MEWPMAKGEEVESSLLLARQPTGAACLSASHFRQFSTGQSEMSVDQNRNL